MTSISAWGVRTNIYSDFSDQWKEVCIMKNKEPAVVLLKSDRGV